MPVVQCVCGGRFQAADQLAGKQVACPVCQRTMSVPAAPAQGIPVACRCGQRFLANAALLNKTVACPACRQPLRIAAESSRSAQVTAPKLSGSPAGGAGQDWLADVPATPSYLPTTRLSPPRKARRSPDFPVKTVVIIVAAIAGIGVLGGAGWLGWRKFQALREARGIESAKTGDGDSTSAGGSSAAAATSVGPQGNSPASPGKTTSPSTASEVAELNRLYRIPDGFVDATAAWLSAIKPFTTPEYVAESARFPIIGKPDERVPSPGKRWGDERAAAELLRKHDASLRSLHELAGKRAVARFQVAFDKGLGIEVVENRSLAAGFSILIFDSQVRARRGDASGACRSLEAALLAARSLSLAPIASTVRAGIALEIRALETAKPLIEQHAVPLEDLARLQRLLEDFQNTSEEPIDLLGDRALTLISYNQPDHVIPNIFQATVGEAIADVSVRQQQAQNCLAATKQDLAADRGIFVEFMEKLIAAAKQPYPDRLSACEALMVESRRLEEERESQGRSHTLASISRLRLDRAFQFHTIHCFLRNTLIAGIAIERKRRDSGALPETLDALVPDYLTRAPVDPFTGQSLVYQPDPARHRAVVYSAGPNGGAQDDWTRTYVLLPPDRRLGSRMTSAAGSGGSAIGGTEVKVAGATVDLLRDLLPRADQADRNARGNVLRQKGAWRAQSGNEDMLTNQSDQEVMWLTVPDAVPPSYLVEMDVEPISGERSFNLAFPVAGRSVMLVIDGFNSQACGLNLVDDLTADRNETTYQGPVLTVGEPTTITVLVTPKGIEATANGQPIVTWQGDMNRLRLDSRFWPDPGNRLMLAAFHTRFKLTRFTLTPLH